MTRPGRTSSRWARARTDRLASGRRRAVLVLVVLVQLAVLYDPTAPSVGGLSSVPGLDVCEGLPRLARVMDKVSVIRSVSHPFPVHGVAYATTGNPTVPLAMELNPRDPAHWPYIGWSLKPATLVQVSPLSSLTNRPGGDVPVHHTPGSPACPGSSQKL